MSYPDIAEMAFGPAGRVLITTLFSLELLAAATATVIVCADSLAAIFELLQWSSIPWWLANPAILKAIVAAILGATVLPEPSKRYGAFLASASSVGVLALLNLVAILAWYGILKPLFDHGVAAGLFIVNLDVSRPDTPAQDFAVEDEDSNFIAGIAPVTDEPSAQVTPRMRTLRPFLHVQPADADEHWVEKNCFPWANEYIKERLVGLHAEDAAIKASITSLTSIQGDVDINQRKGKLITVYDIAFKLAWKGIDELSRCVFDCSLGEDGSGNDASGQIEVPEFMHDTEPEEIVFEVTCEGGGPAKDKIVSLVKKKLLAQIRTKLESFSKDMIESNGKDVHIPSDMMKGHPVLDSYKPKPPAPATSNGSGVSAPKAVGSVTAISMEIEFKCDKQRLFDCLTKQDEVKFWTRSAAKLSMTPGSDYDLFGGNISGNIIDVQAPSKLVMSWRLKSWAQGHFSTVTLEFKELSDSTLLRLSQDGVPIGEKDTIIGNWHMYYWDAIKRIYG
ncbi:hypothetical protein HDU96_000533 [Phlyctochytrium bullatum]|nr:hypothetical protein HDU96_000533 [Phlyctochytrium bullatum]